MTREEAIAKLKNFANHCYPNEEFLMAIQALEQEPMWIPISEMLPETEDDVLATDGVDIFVAWYFRHNALHEWVSSDDNYDISTPIEAWMPLPAPYKPQKEGD